MDGGLDRRYMKSVKTFNFVHVCAFRNPIFSWFTQQGTSGPSRKSLKCRVMHTKVIAHQMCAVHMLAWLNKITNYSGWLKLLMFPKLLVHSDKAHQILKILFGG